LITGSDQAASRLVIDQETLDHLPGIYKAIAEVMIEKGRWQLAEDENGNENKNSRKAPAKACLSDTARNCNELYAGEIY
jgi:hypothetical protein